jgi:hypothetical protein
MEQLLILNRYEELRSLMSGADGGTRGIRDIEIQHLSWLAAHIPTNGNIVEIGSNRGKSICAMGSACMEVGNIGAKLFAVDLWLKGEGIVLKSYSSQETWEIFNKQVAQMGLSKMIRPCMTSSVGAASRRSNPVHLLFIDASHKYKDVLTDYRTWVKFIPIGGRIAFHDYQTRFTGVTRCIEGDVIPSNIWDDVHVYGSIWSATRIG